MKAFRYSTLSDFHRCQQYYKLKHIDGLDDGLGKSADIVFGSCIHLGVQDLFEGGDGVTVYKTYWGLQKDKDLEYTRYGHEALEHIGTTLLEVFKDEHMKKFEPLHLERKMTTSLGKHTFSGTVDCIAKFKGKISVVDWKTAAYPYDQYKLVVNEQTYGYAHLAQQELGVDVEQLVYGVAIKDEKNPRWQFRTRPLNKVELEKKLANIKETCDTISKTKNFLHNPNACVVGKRVCPFFERCHGGNEETNLA